MAMVPSAIWSRLPHMSSMGMSSAKSLLRSLSSTMTLFSWDTYMLPALSKAVPPRYSTPSFSCSAAPEMSTRSSS